MGHTDGRTEGLIVALLCAPTVDVGGTTAVFVLEDYRVANCDDS